MIFYIFCVRDVYPKARYYLFFCASSLILSFYPEFAQTGLLDNAGTLMASQGSPLFSGSFSSQFSASCLTQLTRGTEISEHNTNLVMSYCLNNTIRKLKGLLVMIFIVTAYEGLENFRKLITQGVILVPMVGKK